MMLPWILNALRTGFPVWSGSDVPSGTERLAVPSAFGEMVVRGRRVCSGVMLYTFVTCAAKHAVVRRAQIAGTIGAFAALDFRAAFPQSALPIVEVVGTGKAL